MTSEIDDGGPAFPSTTEDPGMFQGGKIRWPLHGMTLRDWFAGQALAAYVALGHDGPGDTVTLNEIAGDCYRTADAMLRARRPKP